MHDAVTRARDGGDVKAAVDGLQRRPGQIGGSHDVHELAHGVPVLSVGMQWRRRGGAARGRMHCIEHDGERFDQSGIVAGVAGLRRVFRQPWRLLGLVPGREPRGRIRACGGGAEHLGGPCAAGSFK